MEFADFDYEAALYACAKGNKQALHDLYKEESPRLLGVALRIVRQRQSAEDVVHDAFLKIWKQANSFKPERGSGRGWIYSIVRNQALNVRRSSERELSADDDMLEAIESTDSVQLGAQISDAFELRQDIGRLHDCLSNLEVDKRNCILYAYIDGCSHSEISARLQSPLGTVKAWIKRGLSALRECMA